jgi:drug/metabolite transporter (DMT)-like permease
MPAVSRTTNRTTLVLALLAVYLIWGSTYLALRFGLEGFPPFLLNGIRFLLAGAAMYAFLRWRGVPAPSRRQWWNMGRVGALLLVAVGFVTTAEDHGVGSAVAAAAVAVIPVWTALAAGFFGSWPRRLEWVGLAVGFVGVLILTQEGDLQASAIGLALVLIAPVMWALGSVWSTRLDRPQALMATAAQLLTGGVLLLVVGLLLGERIEAAPSGESILALAYLAVFGSIFGYTAYVYLLENARPALATSYAYVNPAVAVVLGVSLGAEVLTGQVFLGLPLILAGVAIIALAQGQRRAQSTEPDGLPSQPLVESGSNPTAELAEEAAA